MFTDATGEVHFEIWEGIRLDGRTFQSLPLFELCREYGELTVSHACRNLGCFPHAQDLSAIKTECRRIEESYV
jgi:hypothetical protein